MNCFMANAFGFDTLQLTPSPTKNVLKSDYRSSG